MTKIDIVSGFLGAGKTTLIKKLLQEAYNGEKVVLIENEFGEIGIDGGFLEDAGVEITEMNSGCICCSLVGDFAEALKKVLSDFSPDRIIIEPSGVGKLSDIIKAVNGVGSDTLVLNSATTVSDVNKCRMYVENFGEFYEDQIAHAGCIILSHTGNASENTINDCIELIHTMNKDATIISTDWEKLYGGQMLEVMEKTNSLENELEHLKGEEKCPVCGHHHHEHSDCDHHHEHSDCDHHHEHSDCEHHHEHSDCEHHHEHSDCEHHHDHSHCDHEGGHCEHEHHHDHHAHHHHHADDVFTSWGKETANKYSENEISVILKAFENKEEYGFVLRAKGIVESDNGEWIHFDYVPGECDIRYGKAGVIGRICVIGSKINEEKIAKDFRI